MGTDMGTDIVTDIGTGTAQRRTGQGNGVRQRERRGDCRHTSPLDSLESADTNFVRTNWTSQAPAGAKRPGLHAVAPHEAGRPSSSLQLHRIEIPGRGSVFVKHFPGPPGAPNLMLLHGWTATADMNWQASYESLSQHFTVVAFDHHGHGTGVRASDRFRLEDCADDAAVVAEALGLDRVIVAGYSMGGPIATLIWRRHPHLVDGLVMCATSRHFSDSAPRRAFFSVLGGTAQLSGLRQLRAAGRLPARAWSRRLHHRGVDAHVVEQGLAHDWTRVFEAGVAIGQFDSRPWAHTIDVPTAVVATLEDVVVPTSYQFEMAEAIDDVAVYRVPGGHTACAHPSGRFTTAVVAACRSVAARGAVATPVGDFGESVAS